MSTAAQPTASGLSPGLAAPSGFATAAWMKVGVVTAAFFILYRHNLDRLWDKTNFFTGDPNWSHSLCIPLIGLYYLFVHRDELARTPVEPLLPTVPSMWRAGITTAMAAVGLAVYYLLPSLIPPSQGSAALLAGVMANLGLGFALYAGFVLLLDWGLGTLLAGVALSLAAVYPLKNDFLWDAGMIVTLFGVVLTLCGWKVMRLAWFPIVFLLCALPWPPLVYSQIASPLQVLAARVSVVLLQMTGIDATYGGTKIFIPQFDETSGARLNDRALNVAEACAGLRSLMTFISIATAVAFLSGRPLWQKLLIAFSAIPIAISCNVLRVAGQGLLDLYAGREWSEGFAHHFAGMVMLLPAFFLIMLVCWILDNLFVEEADEPTAAPAGGAV